MSRVSMKPDDVGVKADSVIGYELALRGGGKLFLQVGNVAEDQARFCAQLEHVGSKANLPISG
jgi:hypothetical protein